MESPPPANQRPRISPASPGGWNTSSFQGLWPPLQAGGEYEVGKSQRRWEPPALPVRT